MVREAQEEASIEIPPSAIEVVGVMHRLDPDERVDFFLSASSWMGEITNMEPDKCAELAWFDLDDLPGDVIPYVRRAIVVYRRDVWFDSFGWE